MPPIRPGKKSNAFRPILIQAVSWRAGSRAVSADQAENTGIHLGDDLRCIVADDLQGSPAHSVDVRVPRSDFPHPASQVFAVSGVERISVDSIAQEVGVTPAAVRDKNGEPGRHRLIDYQAPRFGEAREHQHIAYGIIKRNFLFLLEAGEDYFLQGMVSDEPLDFIPLGAVSQQDQPPTGSSPLPEFPVGTKEQQDVLLGGKPPDEEEIPGRKAEISAMPLFV